MVPFDVVVVDDVIVGVDDGADGDENPTFVPATTAAAADVRDGMEDCKSFREKFFVKKLGPMCCFSVSTVYSTLTNGKQYLFIYKETPSRDGIQLLFISFLNKFFHPKTQKN